MTLHGQIANACSERKVELQQDLVLHSSPHKSLLLTYEIIESFGLEGTLKVQTLSCGQEHLPPDGVTQSPIQPDLEHFWEGGVYNFSEQPVPLPCRKEFLSYILRKNNQNLPFFSLKLLPLILIKSWGTENWTQYFR